MSLKNSKNFLLVSAALAFTLACSLFTPVVPQPAATLDSLYTAAAVTLNAMSTQSAMGYTTTPTLSISSSPTPFATYTAVPPLATVQKCDAAAFIADVTYSDGSIIAPGATFTKTWRIKNVGTCTWTSAYDLVFVGGEKFSGANVVGLPASIGPGESVDVSIPLKAPNQDGHYTGFWKLQNQAGTQFGFGDGEAGIYVDVNVKGYTIGKYDFALYLCDANWRNEGGSLPCPGTDGSDEGFALVMDAPKMEDGTVRGIGLLTHPQKVKNGSISGKFAPLEIAAGDHFKALIGCLDKANDCDMIFMLEYQIGNGAVQTLGQWHEIYEGEHYPIDIDLSFLNGKNVKLILTVLANGSSHEDYGLWVNPVITRQSAKPATITPSPTVTLTATPTSTATNTPTPTDTTTP